MVQNGLVASFGCLLFGGILGSDFGGGRLAGIGIALPDGQGQGAQGIGLEPVAAAGKGIFFLLCRAFGGIMGGVEHTEGADHVFLGHKAGDGSHGGLPVAPAQRGEERGKEVAGFCQHAVLHGCLVFGGVQVIKLPGVVGERPDECGGQENDSAGLLCKGFAALHGAQVDIGPLRHVVGGHFHYKGIVATGKHMHLAQHHAAQNDGAEAGEVGNGGHRGSLANHGTDEGQNGELGTAGHKGGEHDGHAAVFLVFDGAGGHDPRHTAAHAHHERNDGFTAQADGAEQAVEHEGHAGHVAAVLQNGHEQEEYRHLRQEAQHSAHACHDAISNNSLQLHTALQRAAPQHARTEGEQAEQHEPGGKFASAGAAVELHWLVAESVRAAAVAVGSLGAGLEQRHEEQGGIGQSQCPEQHLVQHARQVRANVFQRKGGHHDVEPGSVHVQVMQAAQHGGENEYHGQHGAEHGQCLHPGRLAADEAGQPATHHGPEEHIIGPAGSPVAHGVDGDIVDGIHDAHKDERPGKAVGEHGIYLLGKVLLAAFLHQHLRNEGADGIVSAAGNDGGNIVIHGGFQLHAPVFQGVGFHLAHAFLQQFLALQHLDGLESVGAVFLHDLRHGFFHRLGVFQGLGGGGRLGQHQADELGNAGLLQRTDGHHRAAQLAAQRGGIDADAALLQQIAHVQGNHHGQAGFHELGAQVQVALQVGGIHHVDNHVRLIFQQILAGHDFLRRIGGKGINARQILQLDFLVLGQLAALAVHGHAGPVAHILVSAGQLVEQRGLAAVRVACQCNVFLHVCVFLNAFYLHAGGLCFAQG